MWGGRSARENARRGNKAAPSTVSEADGEPKCATACWDEDSADEDSAIPVIEVSTVEDGNCFFDALSKTGEGIEATRGRLAEWMGQNLDVDLGLNGARTLRELLSEYLMANVDTAQVDDVPWSCAACSLDNAPLFLACAACGLTRRPMFAQGAEVRFHRMPAAVDDAIVDATVVAVNSTAKPPRYTIIYVHEDAMHTTETDGTHLSLACAPASDQEKPAASIDAYISSLGKCKSHWAGAPQEFALLSSNKHSLVLTQYIFFAQVFLRCCLQ